MKQVLTIDTEFKNLAPIITEKAYEELEESLFDTGCREPIHTWNGIILDGHKRYAFCQKWDIPFKVQSYDFTHRCEAIIWICQNNITFLTRSNEELRKYLIGKHYEAAKELFLISYSESRMPRYHYKIATELGLIYNIVPNTVYKYGIYARCLDNIAGKEPQMLTRILSGKLKISHDNIVELSRMPKENIRRLNNNLSETNVEHIGFSEMRHELQWKTLPQPSRSSVMHKATKPVPERNAAIKQMPEYDPDAEISSLTLTIPSWISSIQRTQSIANLPLVSDSARHKIKTQLVNLTTTINEMLAAIEEEI